MKHYLNVCDVNGSSVEPVDVITFGSPCQDLSVAGKRAGLKHESNGDDETTRSGLFMEAVRIIKEMRYADELGKLQSGRANEHIRPRFAVWENVPGAFSSNKGEDFRVVLEELARVKEAEVSIPMPKNGKWQTAGEIIGDGWSIAWRTLDAQFHGVPQRRRRIFLVADFADECAGEILFECKGLPGYSSESCEEGQGIARDSSESIRGTGEGGEKGALVVGTYQNTGIGWWNETNIAATLRTPCGGDATLANIVVEAAPYTLQIRSGCEGGGKGALIQTDKSACLTAAQTQTLFQPIAYGICSYASNSMKSDNPHSGIYVADTARTLDLNGGNPACNQGGICIVEAFTVDADSMRCGEKVRCLVGDHNNRITDMTALIAEPMYIDASHADDVVQPMAFAQQAIGEYKDCDCASSLKMRDYKDATDLVCEPTLPVAFLASGKKAVGTLLANAETKLWLGNQEAFSGDYHIIEKYASPIRYVVRRLTPTECARLQGMPDAWCRLTQIEDMSDEDYEFWKQAHKVDAEIKGKAYREKTKSQMIKWYNGLQADGSEYKAYGNGMALPCVRVPIHGIAKHGAKTMASLFDGIGGFPLAGLIDGIETLWTSEIELFPIAVTKERFEEYEKYGGFTFGAERSKS